jgi:hypothetical protein
VYFCFHQLGAKEDKGMRLSGLTVIAAVFMLSATTRPAEAYCPVRPSPPICLSKSTPFTPSEQRDCIASAQRYFELSDRYIGCLRVEEQHALDEAAKARSRLACRSTSKRPC